MPNSADKACTGKQQYLTKKRAKEAAKRVAHRDPSLRNLHAYRCPYCSTLERPIFHLGHPPKTTHRHSWEADEYQYPHLFEEKNQ